MLTFNGSEVSLTQLLVWLVVALVSGGIAEVVFGYSHVGLLSATVLGMFGALLGSWASDRLGLPSLLTLSLFGIQVDLVWCTLGSIAVIAFLQSIRARRGGGMGGGGRRGYGRRYRREY